MTKTYSKPVSTSARRQRGVTLFVALVLLVMVTLLAVSSFRVSNTNLKIVGNMQGKDEATAAAQEAIERVISNAAFAANPAFTGSTPVNVDLNADGVTEYVVRFTPQPKCIRSRATNPAELPFTPANEPCRGSALIGQSILATSCADTIWEITATTKDDVSGAETTVRQGIAMRVSATEAFSACK